MVRPTRANAAANNNDDNAVPQGIAEALAGIANSQALIIQFMQQNAQAALNAQAVAPPPPPPPVVNQTSPFDKFSRNRPSTYSGSDNPNDLVMWIEEMEKLMVLCHTPAEEQVDIITFFLRNEAADWWRIASVELVNPTWAEFKVALQAKFYPASMIWVKEQEFAQLEMGSLTLQAYTHKFEMLSKFARRLIPDEATRIAQYVRGLDPDLGKIMAGHDFDTFQKAYEKALVIHAAVQAGDKRRKTNSTLQSFNSSVIRKSTRARPTFSKPRFERNNFGNKQPRNFQTRGQNGTNHSNTAFDPLNTSGNCFKCGKAMHPTTTCEGEPATCFICHEVGHKANMCPDKRQADTPAAIGGLNTGTSATRIDGKLYIMTEVEDDGGDYANIITGT